VTLISEEIAQRKQSLAEIIEQIAQTVVARARKGIHHGVLLVPEGLIEFIPEMKALIDELNDGMAQHEAALASLGDEEKRAFVGKQLTTEHAKLFASLPDYIQDMLLAERDSHGNLQLSLIPTEQLLVDMTKRRVKQIADASDTKIPFATQSHFFGYEGRCGAPTLFDAAYTLNLGLTAGALLLAGKTGYMASIGNIFSGGVPLAIPLAGLLDVERRHGSEAVVIEKALVEVDAPAMQYFVSRREAWAQDDLFASPGPRQLWGPVARQVPVSVEKQSGDARLAGILKALECHEHSVISGSVMAWGEALEHSFSLVVFLQVDTAIRLERLRRREMARFGSVNPEFLEWAAQYDDGPPEGRSLAKHTAWLKTRACPVVRLAGEQSTADQLRALIPHLPL
jgi:pyrophosphate--fructose-6-phosphate 1-phosphotransferase